MFDSIATTSPTGPARTDGPAAATQWFARMLDEIDYGMLLVADDRVVLHANHVARAELVDCVRLRCAGLEEIGAGGSAAAPDLRLGRCGHLFGIGMFAPIVSRWISPVSAPL